MAKAIIKKVGNQYYTDIYDSNGKFVKTVETPKSQIREERESLLYKPIEDSKKSYHTNLRAIEGSGQLVELRRWGFSGDFERFTDKEYSRIPGGK